jgi:hypothetical protein
MRKDEKRYTQTAQQATRVALLMRIISVIYEAF